MRVRHIVVKVRVWKMSGSQCPRTKTESKSFISFVYFLQSANVRTGEDVDDLIMGMASQITEREDNIVVEDLRGIKPFFFSAACFKTGTYLQSWNF